MPIFKILYLWLVHCLAEQYDVVVTSYIIHIVSVLKGQYDWFSCDNRNISDVLWEAISQGQVLSLYQGLGTKNLQSFISQFIYFYGYSFFKRLYLRESKSKSIGTAANLLIAAAAGACTVIATQARLSFIDIQILYSVGTNGFL